MDKENNMLKSERRERKRNKSKKMKVSGIGARLLQRVIENKAIEHKEEK